MQASRKFESFCVDDAEEWMIAGDTSGRLYVIGLPNLEIHQEIQVHNGCVAGIAISSTHKFAASLSADRTVSLLSWDAQRGHLECLQTCSNRGLQPTNLQGVVPDMRSGGHSISFHPTLKRLVTRAANASLLELNITDDNTLEVHSCVMFTDQWDLVCAYYVKDTTQVLSGYGDGFVRHTDGSRLIREWQIGYDQVHAIVPIGNDEYICSTDCLRVARIHIDREEPVMIGAPFARDELEQIDYNPVTKRAFLTSFDRNVYEIDLETCGMKSIVYPSPFKGRWIYSSRKQSDRAYLQTRDGAIDYFDLEKGTVINRLRNTPGAIWSACTDKSGVLRFSGEGNQLLSATFDGVEEMSRKSRWCEDFTEIQVNPSAYTKRMLYHEATDTLLLGRTDGNIHSVCAGETHRLFELNEPVHDMDLLDDTLFVATEHGSVFALDWQTKRQIGHFRSPEGKAFWSVAANSYKQCVAVLERYGQIFFLDAKGNKCDTPLVDAGRPKRAKWLDPNVLLHSHGVSLYTLDLRTGEHTEFIVGPGNSIEDFIWDDGYRYVILMSYTRTLDLYDAQSGQMLHSTSDQVDYSKGVMWLPAGERDGSRYDHDFVSYGRSGMAYTYRILDEKIVPMGPLGSAILPAPA